MTETSHDEKLAEYERRYRALAAELAGIGFIHAGSVTRRYTRCASPGCKCHNDPPQPHGPYYQWTAKVHGKTVTRRLTEREADLYQGWIANDRHMRDIIGQMRDIAAKAAPLQLKTATQEVYSQAQFVRKDSRHHLTSRYADGARLTTQTPLTHTSDRLPCSLRVLCYKARTLDTPTTYLTCSSYDDVTRRPGVLHLTYRGSRVRGAAA